MNLEIDSFPAGETYPEAQLPKMGKVAMKVLSLKDEEFYEGMGKYFVTIAKPGDWEEVHEEGGLHHLEVQQGDRRC